MILYNRLIRMDLLLLAAGLSLIFMKSGGLRDALLGFGLATGILSAINHIKHYQQYKKFY